MPGVFVYSPRKRGWSVALQSKSSAVEKNSAVDVLNITEVNQTQHTMIDNDMLNYLFTDPDAFTNPEIERSYRA